MFVGLDGLKVRVRGSVKATDQVLLLEPAAAPYIAAVAKGDHTYLKLNDGVNMEVVRYDGTGEATNTSDGVSIIVTRNLNGRSFNFSSATVLSYGFCTQIIQDIVKGV